ncbi:MAG: helix-turn-helix transcriptional regulator [Planctomycetaceae bacterium]|nr:helix-turn-helix transcriptional regulator [Planctomycetaceae bacterium]
MFPAQPFPNRQTSPGEILPLQQKNVTDVMAPDEVAEWRVNLSTCDHAALLFDGNSEPVYLSPLLRTRLSQHTSATAPAGRPTGPIWQTVCSSAGRLVSESIRSGGSELAEVLQVENHYFSLVGSLLRNVSGRVTGAIVHIGDITGGVGLLIREARAGNPSPGSISDDQRTESADLNSLRELVEQRDIGRQKMARLSRREYEVVSLVADGLPNKSIAHELDISVKTIEKHRANAMRKLGVDSTAEMVRIAVIADSKSAEVTRPTDPPFTSPSGNFEPGYRP